MENMPGIQLAFIDFIFLLAHFQEHFIKTYYEEVRDCQ